MLWWYVDVTVAAMVLWRLPHRKGLCQHSQGRHLSGPWRVHCFSWQIWFSVCGHSRPAYDKGTGPREVSVLTLREQRTLLVAQTDLQIDVPQVLSVPWWGQTKVLGAVHFRWATMTEPVGIFHSYSGFDRVLQCHHGCDLFYPSVALHSSPN